MIYTTKSEGAFDPDWYNFERVRGGETLARTVHESEKSPRSTGLLNHKGEKLYAYPSKEPFGFFEFKK